MADKLTHKIAALAPGSNYVSLEFFPPKTGPGEANLDGRLARMAAALRPLFVNVTWGAGGSTATKSLALAARTQRDLGLTTCLHLTCTNMSRRLVDAALERARELGIRNLLALRGDPPRSDEYCDPSAAEDDSNRDFTWAVDLVRYIRQKHGDWFCIGVAGYPEGHADQSHPEEQSAEHDLAYLVEKTAAGADFIMTQLFYDVEAYAAYEKRLRAHESDVFKTIPIIPGLMPIQSYQILRRTTKLSHASLPTEMLKRLEAVKGDDDAVKRVGVDILAEMVGKMKATPSPGPRGFHFYTLNLEKVVTQILERCDLIPRHPPIHRALSSTNGHPEEAVVADEDSDGYVLIAADGRQQPQPRTRRQSSLANSQPHNRIVVSSERASSTSSRRSLFEAPDNEAGIPQDPSLTSRAHHLAISEGQGALGREATWDDFPNGRWGDARSPAYGEIDGYGVRLPVGAAEARRLWGAPASTRDLSAVFRAHLEARVPAVPWSEEPLAPETLTIRAPLLALVDRGWWTVASQPAVNGVRSSHPVFGWGPRGGFVFQKPFVELFLPAADWAALRPRLDVEAARGAATYFAANAAGLFASSAPRSVNPVTWGVFAGKEIVSPTIVEAASFRAWADEAFAIWAEWRRVFPPGSASAKLLAGVRADVWLVNVIHHAYVDAEGLWEMLLRE